MALPNDEDLADYERDGDYHPDDPRYDNGTRTANLTSAATPKEADAIILGLLTIAQEVFAKDTEGGIPIESWNKALEVFDKYLEQGHIPEDGFYIEVKDGEVYIRVSESLKNLCPIRSTN